MTKANRLASRALLAISLGMMSLLAAPVAAQTAPTISVRGALRLQIKDAFGEKPVISYILIPQGIPDGENNYVIAAWGFSLEGNKGARLAQEKGATCTFTLQERKPKPDWRVLNVSGCTPAPQ